MSLLDKIRQGISEKVKQWGMKSATDREIAVENALRRSEPIRKQLTSYQLSLISQELKDWKMARVNALSVENPNRIKLYQVYEDIMIDAHLTAIIESRILRVIRSPFRIVNQDGEKQEDLTKLLQAPWMRAFMVEAMMAKFKGTGLVEIYPMSGGGIESIKLLSREHVDFHKQLILKMPMDTEGDDYTSGWIRNHTIQLGDSEDLGILLKAGPIAIYKKYSLGDWSEFNNKYGIPLRIGRTETMNNTRVDQMCNMMDNLGSAGWAVLDKDEEVEIVESKGTTKPEEVFDVHIERCNSELSKLILGQTMTTDDGSSRSQAEVHQEVAEDRHESDKTDIKDLINSDLLWRLRYHGIPIPEGYSFDWDESKELSTEEYIQAVTQLATSFQIDTDQITEKTGIKILGTKRETGSGSGTGGNSEDPPANDPDPEPAGAASAALKIRRPNYPESRCCQEHNTPLMQGPDETEDELTRKIFEGYDGRSVHEYYQAVSENLREGLSSGMNLSGINYNQPDHIAQAFMEANLFRFSAAKSIAITKELNRIRQDSNSLQEFRKNAEGILEDYNRNYQRTEFNFSTAVAQNASRYYRQMEDTEANPYFIYKTTGDAQVRPAHQVLHNLVFRKTDPAFSAIYPPNEFGCRCGVQETDEIPRGSKLSTGEDAVELLKGTEVDRNGRSEWDRMKAGGFNINRADLRQVFQANQFYLSSKFPDDFTLQENSLTEHEDLPLSRFPALEQEVVTVERAEEWYQSQIGKHDQEGTEAIRILDRNKKPITLTEAQFKQQLNSDSARHVLQIEEILQQPDEIFLTGRSEQGTHYHYLKFYQNASFKIRVNLDRKENQLKLIEWEQLSGDIDEARTGILTHKYYDF